MAFVYKRRHSALLRALLRTLTTSTLFQQRVKSPRERPKVKRRDVEQSTIDQKTWRARQSKSRRFVIVGLNNRGSLVIVDARVELGGIQSQIGGVLFQIGFGERADIFAGPHREEFIVILPEFALLVRAFRGFCRPVRLADPCLIDDGEVLVGKRDLVSLDVLRFDLATRAKRKLSADRSLKVGELDKGDFGVWITDCPAAGGDAAASGRRGRGRSLDQEQSNGSQNDDHTNTDRDHPGGQTAGLCLGLRINSTR